MTDLRRGSPLPPAEPLAAMQASLTPVEGMAVVEVRRRGADASLPADPWTETERDGAAILCLGPDRWLVAGARGPVQAALAGLPSDAVLVEMSPAYAAIRIEGEEAGRLLLAAASTDLTRRPVAAGRCRRIRLGAIDALLRMPATDGAPAFELLVARSFARDAWSWLAATGALKAPPDLFAAALAPDV